MYQRHFAGYRLNKLNRMSKTNEAAKAAKGKTHRFPRNYARGSIHVLLYPCIVILEKVGRMCVFEQLFVIVLRLEFSFVHDEPFKYYAYFNSSFFLLMN